MSFVGFSQIDTWREVDKTNLVTQEDWKSEQAGQYGSYWHIVRRTPNVNVNGWYGYYVNFYSNSYLYNNGSTYKATSYVEGISITMYEYSWIYFPSLGKYDWKLYNTFTWKTSYKVFDWVETPIARFFSHSPYCVFRINYTKVSPYDYSNK